MLSVRITEVRSSLSSWLTIITIPDTFMAIFKVNKLYRLMIESTSIFSLTSSYLSPILKVILSTSYVTSTARNTMNKTLPHPQEGDKREENGPRHERNGRDDLGIGFPEKGEITS